jgi:hypothetical protein
VLLRLRERLDHSKTPGQRGHVVGITAHGICRSGRRWKRFQDIHWSTPFAGLFFEILVRFKSRHRHPPGLLLKCERLHQLTGWCTSCDFSAR